VISGSGFAMAKTTGARFIDRTISGVTRFLAETPMKTSAPRIASARVRAFVLAKNGCRYRFTPSVRPSCRIPPMSERTRFSFFTPRLR